MCLNWLDRVHQEYHVLILFIIQIRIYPCIVDSPPSWSLLFSFLKRDHPPPVGKFLASKLQMAKDPIVFPLASLIMLFCSSGRGWREYIYIYTYSTNSFTDYTRLWFVHLKFQLLSLHFSKYTNIVIYIYIRFGFLWLRHPVREKSNLFCMAGNIMMLWLCIYFNFYKYIYIYVYIFLFWGNVETRPLRCIPFVFVMKPQCVCLLLKRSHLLVE